MTTTAQLDQRTRFLFKAIDWEPTGVQAEILADTHRTKLITGGGQGGKSTLAAREWLKNFPKDLAKFQALNRQWPMVYWLVAQDYERTSTEFRFIRQQLEQLGLLDDRGTTSRVDPGHISVKGGPPESPIAAVIRTKSAKDFSVLAMEAPMGIIVCEAAKISLDAYFRCVERMAPNHAWLFMSGTMEGSIGWYPAFRKSWEYGTEEDEIAFSLPSYSNTFLYPGGKDDPEIRRLRRLLPENEYLERVEGVPSPPKGLVFDRFNPSYHIKRDLEYEPGEPVYIGYDPGYDHACALEAWQYIDGQVRFFDEIYGRGVLVEELADMCLSKPWWKDVTRGAIDISGTYHHGQTHPAADVFQRMTKVYLEHQKIRINEGNARFNYLLSIDPLMNRPRMVIAPKCRGLLSELGAMASPLDGQVRVYRWKMTEQGDVVGSVPEDANNDAIKAAIYTTIMKFGYLEPTRIKSSVGIKFYKKEGPRKDRRNRRMYASSPYTR